MKKNSLSGKTIAASLLLLIMPITALISLQKAALGSQPNCTLTANTPYRVGSSIFASASISCNRKAAVLLAKDLCLQAYRAGRWTNILCRDVRQSNISSLNATISAVFFGESYRTQITGFALFNSGYGLQAAELGTARSSASR
jgi:hypothetical protein